MPDPIVLTLLTSSVLANLGLAGQRVIDWRMATLRSKTDHEVNLTKRLDDLLERTDVLEHQRDHYVEENDKFRTHNHKLTRHLRRAVEEIRKTRVESLQLQKVVAELEAKIELLGAKLDEALKANAALTEELRQVHDIQVTNPTI